MTQETVITAAIINNLPEKDPFNENCEFTGQSVIGYVVFKRDAYLIWKSDKTAFKTNLRRLLLISCLKENSERVINSTNFLDSLVDKRKEIRRI